jgi:hypothetical protein
VARPRLRAARSSPPCPATTATRSSPSSSAPSPPRACATSPPALQTRLRAHAPRDVAELLPQLEARARERIASAEKQLHRRGEQEAAALAQVIAGQIARIHNKIAEHDAEQLGLDFRDEHEKRQIAADRRYWDTRLPELAREAERAPAAIQRGYAVQAVRVEPVGLVYLWPVSA